MKNISVFIKGGTKTLTFNDPIVTYGSLITTNEVTVFWKFKNITDEIDNKKFTKGSVEVELGDGYWDFEQIKNRLAGEKLELTMNVHDNTCDIVNKTKSKVNLKKFGKLLGFPENKELSADESITHKSPKPVDVNHGLRYLIVTCDLVDKSKNMDLDGVKSDVLAFLPVTPGTRLNSSCYVYNKDYATRSAISSVVPEVKFTVKPNKDVGNVKVDVDVLLNITLEI